MPPPPETPSAKSDHHTAKREKAKADQGHCANCELEGMLTIFRKKSPGCEGYTGLPTCELIDHNGEVKQVRARISCHCSCAVGTWMRGECSAAVCLRIPALRIVGIKGFGMENWTQHDPTLPEIDTSQPADWKAFRVWLNSQGKRGERPVTRVRPEPNGSRREVYREMAEPLPGTQPSKATDWRSLPPMPDVPAMVPVFVPDGSEAPF